MIAFKHFISITKILNNKSSILIIPTLEEGTLFFDTYRCHVSALKCSPVFLEVLVYIVLVFELETLLQFAVLALKQEFVVTLALERDDDDQSQKVNQLKGLRKGVGLDESWLVGLDEGGKFVEDHLE